MLKKKKLTPQPQIKSKNVDEPNLISLLPKVWQSNSRNSVNFILSIDFQQMALPAGSTTTYQLFQWFITVACNKDTISEN